MALQTVPCTYTDEASFCFWQTEFSQAGAKLELKDFLRAVCKL